jgi:hypothetical protein
MIGDIVSENTTFSTKNPKIYDELVGSQGFFKRRYHLFIVALAYGILVGKKIEKKKGKPRDVFLLSTVKDEKQLLLLETLLRMGCSSEKKTSIARKAMDFADGGLELIWKQYQELGTLDLPRLVEAMRTKCEEQIPAILELIKMHS